MNLRFHALLCIILVALAVLLAQLPLARGMLFHHPDERYYTDAALLMMESGDYWTPRFYNGELRPHKPLLTYWAVAGSFQLFGVSPLAARIPSLLAGTLLLGLTCALAHATTRRWDVALLAVCLVASQYTFVLCSNRTTPDIFLTTALTLGFLGVARQMHAVTGDKGALFLILAGAGLAFLAKGLLGIVFLLFVGSLLRSNGAKMCLNWRRLAWFVCIILAAAAWVAFSVSLPHPQFVQGFLYDQVIGRFIKDSWWHKPFNVAGYLLLIPALFLPWWPLMLKAHIRERVLTAVWPPREPVVRAALTWMLLCALIFGLGNKLTARYVFSAVPLLAVILAAAIAGPVVREAGGSANSHRPLPRGMPAAAAAVIVLALASVLLAGGPAGTQILPGLALAGTLALALSLARLTPPRLAASVGWSILSLTVLPLIALAMHVSFNGGIENELPGVITRIQEYPAMRGSVICSIHPSALSRARLQAGRALPVIPARDVGTNAIPATVHARLISELDKSNSRLTSFVPVATFRLPVGSSSEIKKVWRAQGLPMWQWIPHLLREGIPRAEFRAEVRTELESMPVSNHGESALRR